VGIALLDDPDAVHFAAIFFALALWTAVMAALLIYVAVTGRREPPNGLERR
jgi:hypothetical protein